jgi:hypothetical protein
MKDKFLKIWLILFTFSLFFPIHHTFISKESFLTGDYSDFTSFTLYLSEIFIFVGCFFIILPRGREFFNNIKSLKWLILAVFLCFILHFGLNIRFSLYLLVKWLELIVAYGTFRIVFDVYELKSLFLKLFSWLTGLQSVIAIYQFYFQGSLGLFRLGEQHINPNILGVAKIVSGETRFIRAYGTFPHPNPFSAFLVTSIIISLYLISSAKTAKSRITYGVLIFIQVLGLTTTFSRGAYISLISGLIFLTIFQLSVKGRPLHSLLKFRNQFYVGLMVVLVSIGTSYFIFKPFVASRASFSDQSTVDRKFYNTTGMQMAKQNPIFGVGLGESVLHMEQTSGRYLDPWDKQPPHNYFIVAAAELGTPAMLILVWIFISHTWQLLKKLNLETDFTSTTYHLSLVTIFLAFLLLMQFDHYFYTLHQTQLLLWIFLALVSSETIKGRCP